MDKKNSLFNILLFSVLRRSKHRLSVYSRQQHAVKSVTESKIIKNYKWYFCIQFGQSANLSSFNLDGKDFRERMYRFIFYCKPLKRSKT